MDNVAKYVRLASIVYPDTNRQIDYNYDTGPQAAIDEVMSRLSSISEDYDTLAAYRYLGAGTIVEEDYQDIDVKLSYLDGSDDVTGFDRFGRIAEQVWEDYSGTPTVIDEYTYTYDRAGNRTTRTNETKGDSSLDETYTYDDLDRLETMDRADGFDQDWTLDGAGNFSEFYDDSATAQTRSVNEANEIESIGGAGSWVTPAYDAAGNMISGPLAGSETTKIHYIYDAWNRLVAVKEDDSGSPGDTIAAYEYDGANRRIIKTLADNASVEYYYNQNWQLLEERFIDEYSATTAVNQYVWSQQYIDSPIVRFHDGNADGDCDPTTDADDTIRYYAWDANHNVTTTITISHDASPPYTTTTIEHYVYTAYGEATVYTEGWVEVGPPSEDGPLYCGYFFDAETDNHLARNRYYHSTLSTWISRDPMGYLADFNFYRYVGNAPLIYVDPSGLIPPNVPPWSPGEGPFGPYTTRQRPRCTQADIDRDNAEYDRRLGLIEETYYGENGVYVRLRAQRDADLAWWDAQEAAMKKLCQDWVSWAEGVCPQDPGVEADCEMAVSSFISAEKKLVELAFWAAIRTATAMERFEVQDAGAACPCHGKQVGDLKY